jgi:hypothetical protein
VVTRLVAFFLVLSFFSWLELVLDG